MFSFCTCDARDDLVARADSAAPDRRYLAATPAQSLSVPINQRYLEADVILPILRYDAAGNIHYYLADASDSPRRPRSQLAEEP
ncbi:MAG: hypothetical protein AAF750_01180 [Planctomycetota bacterium]